MPLTAAQAAARLNRTERTVRRWIDKGTLQAYHPTHGRKDKFLIEESEVERLVGELAQEQPAAAAASEDTPSTLEARIAQLEQEFNNYRLLSGPDLLALGPEDMAHIENRLDRFEQRLDAIERVLSVGTPAQPAERATRTPHASATLARIEPLEHLPQGSMPHYRFAEMHGVKARTFLDHIHKGHVSSIARQKPNRKETSHWLSPEQQRAAISYWQANDTPYHECDLCPHDDSVYQRLYAPLESQDQSGEQVNTPA